MCPGPFQNVQVHAASDSCKMCGAYIVEKLPNGIVVVLFDTVNEYPILLANVPIDSRLECIYHWGAPSRQLLECVDKA